MFMLFSLAEDSYNILRPQPLGNERVQAFPDSPTMLSLPSLF